MFEERIQRGMEFLDQQSPGWEHKVSLDSLRLISKYDCIMGQLYETFNEGCEKLHLEKWEARRLGFCICPGDLHRRYAILTEEWKEAIQKRINQESKQEGVST